MDVGMDRQEEGFSVSTSSCRSFAGKKKKKKGGKKGPEVGGGRRTMMFDFGS